MIYRPAAPILDPRLPCLASVIIRGRPWPRHFSLFTSTTISYPMALLTIHRKLVCFLTGKWRQFIYCRKHSVMAVDPGQAPPESLGGTQILSPLYVFVCDYGGAMC